MQMEKIINRLAEELEYEREHNKKLNCEIRRLTADLSQGEKEIQKKN